MLIIVIILKIHTHTHTCIHALTHMYLLFHKRQAWQSTGHSLMERKEWLNMEENRGGGWMWWDRRSHWRPQIILLHFINMNKKKLSKRPSDTSTKGLVNQT